MVVNPIKATKRLNFMPHTTLVDLILNYPKDRAQEDVLIFLNAKGKVKNNLTFKDLEQRCMNYAFNISQFASKHEIVLITLEDQEDFVVSFFGCLLAGKIPAPIAPLQHKRNQSSWGKLENILKKQSNASVLVRESEYDDVLGFLQENGLLNTRIYTTEALDKPDAIPVELPKIQTSQVAYIQYTSGSTSKPKGIVLTHEQILKNLEKMYRVFNRGQVVRVAGWIPFYHDMGLVGHLFTVLYESGFGVFLNPSTFLAKPELWLKAFSEYHANSGAAPTFAFKHCVSKIKNFDGIDLSSWQHAYVGSETVTIEVLERFIDTFKPQGFNPNTFRPVYGLAEVTLLAAGGALGFEDLLSTVEKNSLSNSSRRKLIPYTLDKECTTVTIVNPDTLQELPDGQEGDIIVKAKHNFSGYLKYDLNFDKLQAVTVNTGDVGYIKDDNLYITGRRKEIIIVRGRNYSAEDLEHSARQFITNLRPNDATACLQDLEDPLNSVIVLQEIHRHLDSDKQEEIIAQIKANLSDGFGIKAQAILLIAQGTLARTPNYKLARGKCLDQFKSNKLRILSQSGKTSGLATTRNKQNEEVVIVGMACKFPGGVTSLDDFWELLATGTDAIQEVPKNRWNNDLFYDKDIAVPGKVNTKWGGFVDGIDQFDPAFFGVSKYEAAEMDPQQRLVLETSWRLMEHTGWTKPHVKNSNTGVYIGISTNDYLYMKIKLTTGLTGFNAYSGLGNAHSIAANRLSYFYDLKGPSMAIDTACSSSLTAFHLGAQAILNGDCQQAIVGGVNAILSPGSTVTLSQFGMMAPDGRCKAFDQSANGYVRSEGCGLVMLKLKSAALRDGDNILASVVSTAAAQDGMSPGITYPNASAQHAIIGKCLAKSAISPSQVSYVEAHGTGTASGDPIEMEQLVHHYGDYENNSTCFVGSVKANIGHLEASAGIASVIKTVLMLQKKQIPPQIHVNTLNPKIQLENTRIQIAKKLTPWESDQNRNVAISSFGFGGSLAHVILQEASNTLEPKTAIPTDHFVYPFILSGHSQTNLIQQATAWESWLTSNSVLPFADLCFTQAKHRTNLQFRKYFLASDKLELANQLDSFITSKKPIQAAQENLKLCFLFTGQGEHYYDMGRSLYFRYPRYKTYYDHCISQLNLDEQALEKINNALNKEHIFRITEAHAQPLQFALQYALAKFLMDLNLNPDYLLGYSFGEYVAACLAGCFTLKEGMLMVQKRGQLLDDLEVYGSMVTIFESPEVVLPVINPEKVTIAVHNSPKKTVISGDQIEIERICKQFRSLNVKLYYLKTIKPYHSHFIEPILEEYKQFLETVNFKKPIKKWVSSVTGSLMEKCPDTMHWINQTRNTVLFSEAAHSLNQLDNAVSFIEVGPGASTLSAIFENINPRSQVLVRTLMQNKRLKPEGDYLLHALGKLNDFGFNINWENFYSHKTYPGSIPGLALNNKRFWLRGIDAAKLATFAAQEDNSNYKKDILNATNDEGQEMEDNLHYTLKWIPYDSLNIASLPITLADPINWILIGESSPLLLEVLQELKDQNTSVYWMGSKQKGAVKPDIEITHEATKEALHKKFDRIVNLIAKRSIRDYRIVYITPELNPTINLENIDSTVNKTVVFYTRLLKAIKQLVFSQPIWVVTQGIHCLENENGNQVNLAQSVLWGYAKTAYLEHPEWRGGLIDVSQHKNPNTAKQILYKILKPEQERCVLLREGVQYIEQLYAAPCSPTNTLKLRNDGAYIITGGLGGLGLKSAAWLVNNGVKHIILISRRELPQQAQWEQLSQENPEYSFLKELISLKSKVDVLEIIAMDISDVEKLESFFNTLNTKNTVVRGIVHAAGVNWFSKLIDIDIAKLQQTLKIKTAASWQLHTLTKNMDLDCFILFSSVSAVWGSVELSHYTAANYFMDLLARYRQTLKLPALSVNWGPWAEVGMSSGTREVEVLGKLGFNLMPPNTALNALKNQLSTGNAVAVIGDINWGKFKPFVDFSLRPSLFTPVMPEDYVQLKPASEGVTEILNSTMKQARKKIEEVVRLELRRVMLVDSMGPIEATERFNMLGMDSLMAISFVVEIEQYFNINLPNTLPYNYPHIKAVSDYLFQEIYVAKHPSAANYLDKLLQDDKHDYNQNDQVNITTPVSKIWIDLREIKKSPEYTVFCFPAIGSGASAFKPLANAAPEWLSLIGVQAPGREERSNQNAHLNMTELLDELISSFIIPDHPYSLYGHSFGGILAYEFILVLQQKGLRLPENLIVSGTNPVNKPSQGKIHELPDQEMIQTVLESYPNNQDNQTRKQAILNSKDTVRADLTIMETHISNGTQIPCNIHVIVAKQDKVAPFKNMKEWKHFSKANTSFLRVEGSHDILRENQATILETLITLNKK